MGEKSKGSKTGFMRKTGQPPILGGPFLVHGEYPPSGRANPPSPGPLAFICPEIVSSTVRSLSGLFSPFLFDFGVFFRLFLQVFCQILCEARRCKNHCFVIVFTVYSAHRPFHKNQKNTIFCILVCVFREGCRHHFFINFSSILAPFW